ncbi:MAG TPA: hypothetical protein VGD01_05385 [Candidatus Elarobacter sp.]|jgi:hypothetical protein
MRHHVSITVNGEPRDEVVLATPEPLRNVIDLTLRFDRPSPAAGFRMLRTTADESDYVDGAYHFHRWHWWPEIAAGTYRARGVRLRYADGNAIEAPLDAEVVVEVLPLTAAALPVFSVR